MSRRAAAGAAALLLLALILTSQAWAELPRRWKSLRAFAPKELAVRRLGGSGTAFDRRFFSFLENARRRIPKSTKGIKIVGAPANEYGDYLATYYFAPLPVSYDIRRTALGPPVPSGWVLAEYGGKPSPSQRPLATLPEGVLWEMAP